MRKERGELESDRLNLEDADGDEGGEVGEAR